MQAAEPAKREKKGKSHEPAKPVVAVKVDTDLHTNGKVKRISATSRWTRCSAWSASHHSSGSD